jgi:LysM repeat protein
MRNSDILFLEQAYQKVLKNQGLLMEDDATYTVQKGDNLSLIAHKFGISFEELKAANGITDPSSLTVGTVLTLPKGSAELPSDKMNAFINSLNDKDSEDEVHEAPVGRDAEGHIILQPYGEMPLSHRKHSPEQQGGYEFTDSK